MTSENENIIEISLKEEMKSSYIDYAMSVVVGRAIPDVRDGLKPVHRRIIYAMADNNYFFNHAHVKSARIVGETMGKYHPHGDAALYNTLVRMAQDFSLRYPLIDPQGNFGSIDGDPPAAMRYCITGDSLILTGDGLIPVKTLSENIKNKTSKLSGREICCQMNDKLIELRNSKKFQSIVAEGYEEDINIEILSYRGNTNRATKFFDSGVHNIIQVVTSQGYAIKGSENHPILCWSKDIEDRPITVWKTLGRISKDDILILNRKGLFSKRNYNTKLHIPEKSERRSEVEFPKELTEELAFSLGGLVAEGSISDTVQQRLSFNNKDPEYYEKVKRGLLNTFPGISLYERTEYEGLREFSLHYRDVLDFLYNIGLHPVKSDAKEIPFSVLRSSKRVIVSFLQGLFEGDGSIQITTDARHGGKASNLTYISKSIKLLNQLKYVLLSFGITTSHLIPDPRNGTHRIAILGMESKQRFADEIGFFSYRKTDRLKEVLKIDDTRLSKTDFIPYLSNYFRGKYKYRFNEYFQKQNIDRYSSLRKKINYIHTLVEVSDASFLEQVIQNNYLFQGIVSINQLPKERVYSIRVDSDCHSFTANGFINHNTEARLAQISNELIEDLDNETVDFVPNFDDSLKEPAFLPAKLPNMLINGTKGIAVGMATSMPPHNLTEICQGIIATVDVPEISTEELMEIIKGPDFPTGGSIIDTNGIYNAYTTGMGNITLRGTIETETKGNKNRLIISEIPYLVNKTTLIESIAKLLKDGVLKDVRDLRDESDRKGMRIVIELSKNAQPVILKNIIFKRTRLQTTFNISNLVLINEGRQPKILNLKELIEEYIEHRLKIIYKRTEFHLKKAKSRLHKVEGLLIALNNIDDVVNIIKSASDTNDAKIKLKMAYKLSDIQVQAILSMPLSRLTNLEQQKLVDEEKSLKKSITELEKILKSKDIRLSIIKQELTELNKKYGDKRKTRIEIIEDENIRELKRKDLIKKEPTIVIFTKNQYVKRISVEDYHAQRRGGRGKKGMTVREEDFITDLFVCSTHATILIFTSQGRVYSMKCFELPLQTRTARGKPIINLIALQPGENISAMIPINNFDTNEMLIMTTKRGIIKKVPLRLFSKFKKTGVRAHRIRPGDELISVKRLSNELQDIFIATKLGYAVRFDESELRELGRTSMGVKGASLRKGDEVIDSLLVTDDKIILTLTEKGYGQRTFLKEYRKTGRNAKGVKNISLDLKKNDKVIAIKMGKLMDILIGTEQGQVIRLPVDSIRITHRKAKGVRAIKLYEDDSVVAIGKCATYIDEKEEK